MVKPGIIKELQARGMIQDATHLDELEKILDTKPVTFYIGFDATADSLTLGHFMTLLVMKRMQEHGHRPIALLGGGTTMIGDPSGRNDMRKVLSVSDIDTNAEVFREQFGRFLDFGEGGAVIVNNASWLRDLNYLDFMRNVGVHFTVARMLTMETYKSRLEQGLSFFEFSYLLLQSYDFLHLYETMGCTLQMGGADQWSNILGGTELIRRVKGADAYALTMKLLTTSTGEKMGKSAGNALWLDEEKTSAYELYQYMRNTADADVERYLLTLTLLPVETCQELGRKKDAEINASKDVLAYEVVRLIHGEAKAKEAQELSKKLFSEGTVAENMPGASVAFEKEIGLLDLLRESGLTKSNGEGRRLVQGGGISIDDEKVTDPAHIVRDEDFEKGYIVVKKGKKSYLRIEKA